MKLYIFHFEMTVAMMTTTTTTVVTGPTPWITGKIKEAGRMGHTKPIQMMSMVICIPGKLIYVHLLFGLSINLAPHLL
jgi:hypothetical protein